MSGELEFMLREVFILHRDSQSKYKIRLTFGGRSIEETLEGNYAGEFKTPIGIRLEGSRGHIILLKARKHSDEEGLYEEIGRGELDLHIFKGLNNGNDLVSGVIYGSRPSNLGKIIAKYSYKTSGKAKAQTIRQDSANSDKRYVFVNHKRRQKLPTFKFKQSILEHSKQISNKLSELTRSMNSIIEQQSQEQKETKTQHRSSKTFKQHQFNTLVRQRESPIAMRKYTTPIERNYTHSYDDRQNNSRDDYELSGDSPINSRFLRIKNQSGLKKQLSVSTEKGISNSKEASLLSKVYRVGPTSYLLRRNDLRRTENKPIMKVNLKIGSVFFHLYNSKASMGVRTVSMNFEIDEQSERRVMKVEEQPEETEVNIEFLQVESTQIMKINCLGSKENQIGCCNIIIKQLMADSDRTTHHTFLSHLGNKVGYLILYFKLTHGSTDNLRHVFQHLPMTPQQHTRNYYQHAEPHSQLQVSVANFNFKTPVQPIIEQSHAGSSMELKSELLAQEQINIFDRFRDR